MRPCQLDDFGNSSLTDKYFYSWNGFIILCPEKTNSDGKNLTLNGAWGMNQTKSLEFRVERCSDEQGSYESDENIDSFLRDLRIQTWIIQEHIDFRKIDKVPVSKQMVIVDQSSSPLGLKNDGKNTYFEATALMQKNTYNTYDSWFDIG